ncbi:MAG: TetR family transcriptional regulator C-terminal domain-containing protein [Ktedonobacteraceae bacterium]
MHSSLTFHSNSDPARGGCFLVNAQIELAPSDPEVFKRVQSGYDAIEEVFYHLLIKAQAAGRLIAGRIYDFPDISVRVPGSKRIVRANNDFLVMFVT